MKISVEKTVKEVVEIEVKPCPFCGGTPSIEYHPGQFGYYHSTARIECERCNASIEKGVPGKTEEEAYRFMAGRWNRRATDD